MLVGLCLINILEYFLQIRGNFYSHAHVCFEIVRNTPCCKLKCPITIDEIDVLMTALLQFYVTYKPNQNFQRMFPAGHSLLVKWNKFQTCYKNRIQHFLPRVGEHPHITLQVVLEWNPGLKKQKTEDVVIPVDFPPELVRKYKEANDVYVPQTPIKTEEAVLLRRILAMDQRFLYGSGLQWNQEPEPQPASGRNKAAAAAGAGPAGGGAGVGGGASAGARALLALAGARKEPRGDNGGAVLVAGPRGRGRGRGGARRGADTIEMEESQDRDADTEDESHVATIDKDGTRSTGKSRYPHCWIF